ncbi:MAG: metallophosphoesterase [Candidatus Solibacter sp.]
MPRLLIFSDIHNDWKTLERLLSVDADYYIAAGDLATWGRGLDRAGQILKTQGEKVWVLPGNHETAGQIAALCDQYGFHDFHRQHFQAGGWHVAGLGYSSPTPFDTPGEYSEAQIAEYLEPFAKLQPLVLVCHAPPYGTALDQVHPGLQAGSTAVRDFIQNVQPGHFFCGHIHEAEGVAIEMGKTQARNVGKKAYLLEVE